MTLWQAHKRLNHDGIDFWMPVGPAFFSWDEAAEYFKAVYDEPTERYELRETAPLSL